jgi:hypothetical protein
MRVAWILLEEKRKFESHIFQSDLKTSFKNLFLVLFLEMLCNNSLVNYSVDAEAWMLFMK